METVSDKSLLNILIFEKNNRIKGGIYNKLQVDFAYNSNHIEGSKLSHDQTKYIFETKTVGIEPARVNDVFEAANHFRCFDRIIDTINEPLDGNYIKELHRILKSSVMEDSHHSVVGDYKKFPNYVGDIQTTAPENVAYEINSLMAKYNSLQKITLYEIIDFHAAFEKIHPFYDGNGRVGRLIMFKECLKNDIVPFFIDDEYKGYYYQGLKQWQSGKEKEFLADTCLAMQDIMKKNLDYFGIVYDKTEIKSSDILNKR